MNTRNTLTAIASAIILITASGCAVTRGQESTGAYIDDSAITTSVTGAATSTVPTSTPPRSASRR